MPAELYAAARQAWDEAVELGAEHGYRNAQATVLAPTGTIGFMMDCDTTGVEPDIALVKYKKLVGGGLMKIVNQTVPMALRRLGYNDAEIGDIVDYIDEHETIEGAPHLLDQHLPVFDCAFKATKGERSIHYMGHIKMMGATQPFISGAISKTVNVPKEATVEDIMQAYIESWKLGAKAISIYRDGSKRTQPLNTSQRSEGRRGRDRAAGRGGGVAAQPSRCAGGCPTSATPITHKFDIAGHEGYVTVGLFEDGTPGRDLPRDGEGGLDDLGLRRRVRAGHLLRAAVRRAAAGARGQVQPHALRAVRHDEEPGDPLREVDRRLRLPLAGDEVPVGRSAVGCGRQHRRPARLHAPRRLPRRRRPRRIAGGKGRARYAGAAIQSQEDAPPCSTCGSIMIRSGSCYKCANCGTTSGCA